MTSKEMLGQLMDRHYADALRAKVEGRLVAWATSISPQELLETMDITVVYPENHAAAIGARKCAPELIAHSEGQGYSSDLCSYARVNLGYMDVQESLAGNIPLPDIIFCCNNICNTVIKWYENIAKELNIPMILFDLPFNHRYEVTEQNVRYIRSQFEDAIHVLENLTGQPFDYQKLERVMEVSSHALFLDRVYGVSYEVGVFTNLTQDHLDFHGTMENYCGAKSLLFRQCDVGVYNSDDPWAERVMAEASCRRVSVGERAAGLTAENIRLSAGGVAFDAVENGAATPVQVGIPGGFTVYNALGVMAAARELGVPLADSARVLRQSAGVKGRVEVVPVPGEYTVLIDYAVTPDAIENVLATVRDFAKGRVVILFGCGGDRDRGKRPKMGRIAAQMADFVVVTSDNPRTEVPGDIIADILPGLEGTETPYVVVEDRVEAIRYALDHARKDDVIILAGKGHETYQIVGHEKRHLDEREVVAAYIAEHKERA